MQAGSRSALLRQALVLMFALVLWGLLMAAQASVGPRDGTVARLVSETGVTTGLGALLSRWQASGMQLALLLLAAPALLAATPWLARGGRIAVVIFLGAAAMLCILEMPQLSNDLFLYRAAGEMLADGTNPYLTTPAQHFGARALIGVPWTAQTSPYGPLALELFALNAKLSPSWITSLWTLRIAMALPWLLLVLFAWRDRSPGALLAAGASPLILLEVVQSGHLDGWMGILLVAVCALATRDRPGALSRTALVLALAAAIAVKATALVVVGALFVHLLRHPAWGLRPALLALAASALCVLLAWLPLWTGPEVLAGLRAESGKVLQSIYQILGTAPSTAATLSIVGSGLALVLAVFLVRRGWGLPGACVAALIVQAILGRSFLQPWYFVAPLMIAAASGWGDQVRSKAEGALLDCRVWAVAGASLIFGAYALVFATRRLDPAIQTANVALMLLPGLTAFLLTARRRG